MDALIKLKIKLDFITGQISAFCMRKRVRFALLTLKWLVLILLLVDLFIYGLNTGNSILFVIVFSIVVGSLLRRKKAAPETSGPTPRPTTAAGMTGICEKCGTKVSLNYGDAYHTLCEKCT